MTTMDHYVQSSGFTTHMHTDDVYDANDRRTRQTMTANNGTPDVEKYVYDVASGNDQMIAILNSDNTLKEALLNGSGTSGTGVVAEDKVTADDRDIDGDGISDGHVAWNLVDHEGSVRAMMNNQGHVFQQVGYDGYGNITYSGVPSGSQVEEDAGSYVPVYSDVLTFPGARGSGLEMRDFTSDDLAMLIGPTETIGVQTNAGESITVTIPADAILFDNTDGHWGIDDIGIPVTITDGTHSYTIDAAHNNIEMRALAGGGFKVREAGDGVSAKELSTRGWINSDGDLNVKMAVVGDASTFVKAKPTVFSSLPVRFAFDGMEWKPDEAMYDAWHRMYDPGTGTFTSEDPANADPVNESRFVGNDPLNLTDTNGLMAGSYVNSFTLQTDAGNAQEPALGSSFDLTPPPIFQFTDRPGYGPPPEAIPALVLAQKAVEAQNNIDLTQKWVTDHELALQQIDNGTSGYLHPYAARIEHEARLPINRQQLAANQDAFSEIETQFNNLGYKDAVFDYSYVGDVLHLAGGRGLNGAMNAVRNMASAPADGLENDALFLNITTGFAGGLFGMADGASAKAALGNVALDSRLNILNPNFMPSSSAIPGIHQGIVDQVVARMAKNPVTLGGLLNQDDALLLAKAPFNQNIILGNIIERQVTREIENSPLHSELFQSSKQFAQLRGAVSVPDFIGRGVAEGQMFDVTTTAELGKHLARWQGLYGQTVHMSTYDFAAAVNQFHL